MMQHAEWFGGVQHCWQYRSLLSTFLQLLLVRLWRTYLKFPQHRFKSSILDDSPLLFHTWMESSQFFKLLLEWGWIDGSCLESRPEGRVKGIPPVWRHWQPQHNHPKSLTGTHNPPLVQDLLTMFLECIWPYYSTRYQYMLSTDTL